MEPGVHETFCDAWDHTRLFKILWNLSEQIVTDPTISHEMRFLDDDWPGEKEGYWFWWEAISADWCTRVQAALLITIFLCEVTCIEAGVWFLKLLADKGHTNGFVSWDEAANTMMLYGIMVSCTSNFHFHHWNHFRSSRWILLKWKIELWSFCVHGSIVAPACHSQFQYISSISLIKILLRQEVKEWFFRLWGMTWWSPVSPPSCHQAPHWFCCTCAATAVLSLRSRLHWTEVFHWRSRVSCPVLMSRADSAAWWILLLCCVLCDMNNASPSYFALHTCALSWRPTLHCIHVLCLCLFFPVGQIFYMRCEAALLLHVRTCTCVHSQNHKIQKIKMISKQKWCKKSKFFQSH